MISKILNQIYSLTDHQLNVGHGVVNPRPDNADQLSTHIDRLRTQTLIVPMIPFLRAVFHLHCIIGRQGQTLEATTSCDGARGDEIVQRQSVEGPESATRTLDSLVNGFGRRIDPIGIIASGPGILDVIPRLELLKTLGVGVVDILGVGDELRRGRSVGGRHFEWRTG